MDLSFRAALSKVNNYQGKPIVIPVRLASIGGNITAELSRYGQHLAKQYIECVKATRMEF